MKEYAELIGALAIVVLGGLGIILFIALFYGAVFGTIGGVIYLVAKGIVGLFQ